MKTSGFWLALVFLSITALSGCSNSEHVALNEIHLSYSGTLDNNKRSKCIMDYISYASSGQKQSYSDKKAKVKLRGDEGPGGALFMPKKSYTLKLSTGFPLNNHKSDKNWILNATYTDKTLMRHKLSFDLFRAFSKRNLAPLSSFLKVFVNQEYQGIYVLMERPDKNRLMLDPEGKDAFIFKDPAIFVIDPHSKHATSKKGAKNPYWQKYPKVKVNDFNPYLKSVSEFIYYSSDSLFNSPENGISSFFDIDNIIDWHIYLIFSNNTTGPVKNFFLYKISNSSKMRIALWDADRGYGRDDDNEKSLNTFVDMNANRMIKRLTDLNSNDYNNRLSKRWKELTQNGPLSIDSVYARIDKNIEILRPQLEENYSRWPVNGELYFDDNNFDQEIELMKTWISKRYPKVEDYLLNLPD